MEGLPGMGFWEELFSLLRRGLESAPRVERRPEYVDVFERHVYIAPGNIVLEPRGFRVEAVFNPGGYVVNGKLRLYARIVVGYYWYVSAIARLEELKLDDLLELSGSVYNDQVRAQLVITPTEWFESGRGCEDPRVHHVDGKDLVLYTGVAATDPDEQQRVSYQALAVVENDRVLRKDILSAVYGGERKPLPNWKNGAILSLTGREEAKLLVRPLIDGVGALWVGNASLNPFTIKLESLRIVMKPMPWEWRLGWSTNPVKLDGDAYLVGWHAVLRSNMGYYNGLLVLSREGELLGYTNYLLGPKTVYERLGDRPFVVYGCLLTQYSERLVWVGGAADTFIAVYSAELDKILEHIKWLKK